MDWQHYLEKARTLPPHVLLRKALTVLARELRLVAEEEWAHVRSWQISDAALQRALMPDVTLAQLPTLLRSGAGIKFFIDPSDKEERIALLRQVTPEAPDLIVAEADRICNHIFDLLGSGPAPLGEKIDWHVDFKTGHRWNFKTYYKRIRPAPYPGGYDIKVAWELSRCQHFVRLGQAYWITGDEKYAEEFVAQVQDWIESNPWPLGVNWACTMEVAIRAVNWLWGLAFFLDSPQITDEFLLQLARSLYGHGRHIVRNLEGSPENPFNGNHYLAGLVGLVYLGICCPFFREASEWVEFGSRELWREISKQIYPDGVHYEGSIPYHRLVTEFYTSAILLCWKNNVEVPSEVTEYLQKMMDVIYQCTKPDGSVPIMGDQDNGRLHRLAVWSEPAREWVDYRYLLAIAAVIFGRSDFAQVCPPETWQEAVWLLAGDLRQDPRMREFLREVVSDQPLPIPMQSIAFQDGGLYIMRMDDQYALVTAGPTGKGGTGNHSHSDLGSFELCVGQYPVIVDPGSYVYTSDWASRRLFRSSVYHNSVTVDGRDVRPLLSDSLFRVARVVNPTIHTWHHGQEYDLLDFSYCIHANNDVYHIKHRRRFICHRALSCWFISDLLSLDDVEHLCEFRFCFHPATSVVQYGSSCIHIGFGDDTSMWLIGLSELTGNLTLGAAEYSPSYGMKVRTQVARFSTRASGSLERQFILFSSKHGERIEPETACRRAVRLSKRVCEASQQSTQPEGSWN